MNILLTGATGFLGSHLLSNLIAGGHKVTIVVRRSSSFHRIATLLDQVSIFTVGDSGFKKVFENNNIETIIHCATNYGRGEAEFSELLEANLFLPLKLLQEGFEAGVCCFINTDTVLERNISDYALSKKQFREWLNKYGPKMACINVVLEHFYGPRDEPSKFVSFIVKQLLDGVDNINLTPGEQKRDFIFIDDVVSAFLRILDNLASIKSGCLEYQIGTDKAISIKKFVELTKQLTGNTHTRLNFGAVSYRENEAMETEVDTSAIRSLGWEPGVSLEDGLSRMIAQEREIRTG